MCSVLSRVPFSEVAIPQIMLYICMRNPLTETNATERLNHSSLNISTLTRRDKRESSVAHQLISKSSGTE